MTTRAPIAAPTPIPAFAPVERPDGLEVCCGAEEVLAGPEVVAAAPGWCVAFVVWEVTGTDETLVDCTTVAVCARSGADAGLNFVRSLEAQATTIGGYSYAKSPVTMLDFP